MNLIRGVLDQSDSVSVIRLIRFAKLQWHDPKEEGGTSARTAGRDCSFRD